MAEQTAQAQSPDSLASGRVPSALCEMRKGRTRFLCWCQRKGASYAHGGHDCTTASWKSKGSLFSVIYGSYLLEPQVPGTPWLLGYFSLHTSALRVFGEQANGLRTETQIVGFVRKQDSKEIRPFKPEENQP